MRIPNTFNINASCKCLLEFSSKEELLAALPQIREAKEQGKLLVIGRGSNLLPKGDYDGTVVRSRIMGRSVVSDTDNEVLLQCGSGETVDEVIEWSIAQGFHGMENLSLIPGEVGASAVQNIGAYGVEAKDVIRTIDAIEINSGREFTITNAECQYGYRQSIFKKEWKGRFIITHVTYRLNKTFTPRLDYGNIKAVLAERSIENPTAQQLRQVIIDIRNAKLPDYNIEGNAGSFFMNPIVERSVYENIKKDYPSVPSYPTGEDHVKIPAGWMIEQCGWKGKSLGNAGVHDKQALVLVNRGGATGDEIVALCQRICEDVKARFGITISPEVNIV